MLITDPSHAVPVEILRNGTRSIAVGNGKRLENGELVKPAVKTGDRILFGKYGGTEIKLDGEEHVIIREDEVLGIMER